MSINLENWYVVNPSKLAVAPDYTRNRIHLMGKVFGHPDYVAGATICTSKIVDFDGQVCSTESGFVYTLGAVLPNYESEHPRARQQLKARLKSENNPHHKEQTTC